MLRGVSKNLGQSIVNIMQFSSRKHNPAGKIGVSCMCLTTIWGSWLLLFGAMCLTWSLAVYSVSQLIQVSYGPIYNMKITNSEKNQCSFARSLSIIGYHLWYFSKISELLKRLPTSAPYSYTVANCYSFAFS